MAEKRLASSRSPAPPDCGHVLVLGVVLVLVLGGGRVAAPIGVGALEEWEVGGTAEKAIAQCRCEWIAS